VIAALNRDQIVSRFEKWLDSALARESPPEGIEAEILSALTAGTAEGDRAEDETSLYALWAATTALSQEVKLQGRAFKELTASLDSQTVRVGEELRAACREREREAERRSRKEILGSLLDIRDRLERGLQSARASASTAQDRDGWVARILGKRRAQASEVAVAALIRGYELSMERLDQVLEDFNARPIRAVGGAFDPRRMNAIEKQESDDVPEGTVLEVYQTGYEWNGEVFRTAQVKVSVGGGDVNQNE
jgi:molecular chaperone GrpE